MIDKEILLEAVRESVTVVRPGELIVIRVPEDKPYWARDISQALGDYNDFGFQFLVLPAEVEVFKQEEDNGSS